MAYKLLDRDLRGVGRLQKSFGTDDPTAVAGVKVMVEQLYKSGDHPILRDVIDGKLTLLQVYAKWKTQSLRTVTTTNVLPYDPTVYEWLSSYDGVNDRTRQNYRLHFKQLQKVKPSFSVAEIPDVLKRYRAVCAKEKKHRYFNMVRNSLRSFLVNYFDQFHPVYQSVVAVKPLEERRKDEERSRTVAEVWSVVKKLSPAVGKQFWTMCLTGAGVEEFKNGLSIEGDGIRIKGEKMIRKDNRRNRLVPLVEDPQPLVLHEKQFRVHLKKASNGTLQPYDARRCYARWALEAGIPYDRVQQYMGHAASPMTARYARGAVGVHLKADAELLKKFITAEKGLASKP